MSILFTDTMTVYNYKVVNQQEKWYRHIVNNIQWRHSKNKTELVDGVLTNTVGESITVDFGPGKQPNYLAPTEWNNNDPESYWTLDSTTNMDVIVLGECEAELTDEYTISNLLKDHKGNCGTVKEVADNRNRGGLPNIKVIAR